MPWELANQVSIGLASWPPTVMISMFGILSQPEVGQQISWFLGASLWFPCLSPASELFPLSIGSGFYEVLNLAEDSQNRVQAVLWLWRWLRCFPMCKQRDVWSGPQIILVEEYRLRFNSRIWKSASSVDFHFLLVMCVRTKLNEDVRAN